MNKKQKHGWVVQSKTTEYYQAYTDADVRSDKTGYYYGDKTLKSAHVYATRKLARADKHSWERIYKVATSVCGKAVAIIPGR